MAVVMIVVEYIGRIYFGSLAAMQFLEGYHRKEGA
jgi:hypothetical protein